MLSSLVISFLPRRKSFNFRAAVTICSDLEPKKIKIKPVTISTVFPSICHEVVGLDGEGNGIPLQYSCLKNPMDGGAWKAAVHGVAEGRTRLSDFTFTFHFHTLEKEMAIHSSVLASRLPGTEQPGGRPSMGSQESDTTEAT